LTASFVTSLITHLPLFVYQQALVTSTSPLKQPHYANLAFFTHLLKRARISCTTFILALYYLHRLNNKYSVSFNTKGLPSHWSNPRELFLAALVVADKYHSDVTYDNQDWSLFTIHPHIALRRLNVLERQLLNDLEFDLNVTPASYVKFLEYLDGMIAKEQMRLTMQLTGGTGWREIARMLTGRWRQGRWHELIVSVQRTDHQNVWKRVLRWICLCAVLSLTYKWCPKEWCGPYQHAQEMDLCKVAIRYGQETGLWLKLQQDQWDKELVQLLVHTCGKEVLLHSSLTTQGRYDVAQVA
jgi:hypothetical protein